MTRDWWIGIVVLLLALAAGSALGRRSYEQISDPRPVCGTCHHDQTRLEGQERAAPHDTRFAANCHSCHVLPVREYTVALSHRFGLSTSLEGPDWENPIIGGQTCLGCHVGRGRGAIACEHCHTDGQLDIRLNDRCEACHPERPSHPHAGQVCRDCHVGAAMDNSHRTQSLMHQKLEPR